MPRYRRFLGERLFNLLKPGEALSFLLDPVAGSEGLDQFALDVQLRRGDVIQYYHGTTCLLTITSGGDFIQGEAAAAYQPVPGYADLTAPCPIKPDDLLRVRQSLAKYLPAAMRAADPRYYRNRKEGYWQNCLSVAFGRNWHPGMDWLIIDREVVIEFPSDAERRKTLAPHREQYLADPASASDGEPNPVGQAL